MLRNLLNLPTGTILVETEVKRDTCQAWHGLDAYHGNCTHCYEADKLSVKLLSTVHREGRSLVVTSDVGVIIISEQDCDCPSEDARYWLNLCKFAEDA
jgi:hypothetical protein